MYRCYRLAWEREDTVHFGELTLFGESIFPEKYIFLEMWVLLERAKKTKKLKIIYTAWKLFDCYRDDEVKISYNRDIVKHKLSRLSQVISNPSKRK